jgi:hypothetical protein
MPIQPVSAVYRGLGEWETPGVSFSDYERMAVQTRKQSGERRLPTPSWALNYSEQRELLVYFMERRALNLWHRSPSVMKCLPLDMRLAMAQATIVARCSSLVALIDKLSAEYVGLKKQNPKAPRVRQLETLIENLDTRLRFERKDGGLGCIARTIHLYYSVGLDSVGVGAELGIKPPQVRRTIFMLHKAWATLNGGKEKYRAELAQRKAEWSRTPVGPRPKPKQQPAAVVFSRHYKLASKHEQIVELYRAGWRVSAIAREVGTGNCPGKKSPRIAAVVSVLKHAGVYHTKPR